MGNYPVEKLHECKCSYCQSEILFGYRYKCLECKDYDLCGECFEKRHFNALHQTRHKMIRFTKARESHCGTNLYLDWDLLNLEHLIELYKYVVHLGTKCKICEHEPIIGLRFKCDCCQDFDMCSKCCKYSFNNHCNSHPSIVHFQTKSLEIDFSHVKLEKELGKDKGGFGSVHKALYKNKQSVACKIIKANSSDMQRYDAYCISYIREIEAYNKIKGAKPH
jgi:hypothetical protein